jgi:hypothetical protein
MQEIKKVGGLGWKTKLVVGWATNREIADGLLIIDKAGNQKQLTAIALREELFNRLVAMGAQMWEAWWSALHISFDWRSFGEWIPGTRWFKRKA